MPRKMRYIAGFTLVELLVVIAIISVMVGLAVPSLNRMGVFGRDPVNGAARQLLVALKAARDYAGANRVDTAVVYSLNVVKDSREPDVHWVVIDGYAIARRLKAEELQAAGLTPGQIANLKGSETGDLLPFVPVKNEEGQFRRLPKGGVILGLISGDIEAQLNDLRALTSENDQVSAQMAALAPASNVDSVGLSPVRLVDSDLNLVEPRLSTLQYQSGAGYQANRFPAHVFKPSGIVQNTSALARFKLYAAPSPDAPPNARFLEDDKAVPNAQVNLYAATGRASIAAEEGT